MRSASIIIPIWGDPALTDACLDALERTTKDYDLVLVDNTGVYQSPIPYDTIFHNTENRGWSGGNNQGVTAVTTDTLVFLNCDAEPEVNWLSELLSAFDDPDVGM